MISTIRFYCYSCLNMKKHDRLAQEEIHNFDIFSDAVTHLIKNPDHHIELEITELIEEDFYEAQPNAN